MIGGTWGHTGQLPPWKMATAASSCHMMFVNGCSSRWWSMSTSYEYIHATAVTQEVMRMCIMQYMHQLRASYKELFCILKRMSTYKCKVSMSTIFTSKPITSLLHLLISAFKTDPQNIYWTTINMKRRFYNEVFSSVSRHIFMSFSNSHSCWSAMLFQRKIRFCLQM